MKLEIVLEHELDSFGGTAMDRWNALRDDVMRLARLRGT